MLELNEHLINRKTTTNLTGISLQTFVSLGCISVGTSIITKDHSIQFLLQSYCGTQFLSRPNQFRVCCVYLNSP